MSAECPFVSVIVPVYDDAAGLQKLLHSLATQDYPAAHFECVVVDNHSTVPVEIHEEFPFDVRVLRQDEGGQFAARNRGVRDARGSILAFTDADCVPRPDWLSTAISHLRHPDKPVFIGGKIQVVPDAGTPRSFYEWHSLVHDLDQQRYIAAWHFAATANLIVLRDVFSSVGEFDDTLMSGGDFEWGRRVHSQGISQIYADDVVVQHPTRADWKSLMTRHRRLIGGQYMMALRAGRSRMTVATLILKTGWASASRSLRDERMTLPDRVKVTALDGALRFVQLVECARLSLGGEVIRR